MYDEDRPEKGRHMTMVSWEFVIEALEGYGFPSSFVHMVMACISSTNFSVRINGEAHGYFAGQRRLRRGDPISLLYCLSWLWNISLGHLAK